MKKLLLLSIIFVAGVISLAAIFTFEEKETSAVTGFTDQIVFDNQSEYKIVAGVIRNDGSGWQFISDTGHEPLNIVSVTQDAYAVRINYNFTATRVVSVQATPDEMFSRDGIKAGVSGGLDHSLIYISKESAPGIWQNPANIVSTKGNFWIYGIFKVN